MSNIPPTPPTSSSSPTPATQSAANMPPGVRGSLFDRLVGVSSWLQARALVYLAVATATVFGIWKLFGQKETGFGPSDWQFWVVVVVIVVPILVAFFGYLLPDIFEKRRRRKLADWSVKGDAGQPGHFQLAPRGEEDRDTFDRDDKAHERALAWVRKCASPVLYLTGVSGSGKSSILAAYVVPNLQHDTLVVSLRASDEPLRQLREALLAPDAVWKADTAKKHVADDLPTFLKAALEHLAGKKRQLLLVFDQFEEFLVLHSAGTTAELAAILDLLQAIAWGKYGDCRLLLSLRLEFRCRLTTIGLPCPSEDINNLEVEAFLEAAAEKFLAMGLESGPKLRKRVIAEAVALDDLSGLIRPITLNMVGQILRRMPAASNHVAVGEQLFTFYFERLLQNREIREYAPNLLRKLINEQNRRVPKTVEELAGPTGDIDIVNGCLGWLASPNRGLVRCLNDSEQSICSRRWEISHDFVASVLGNVLPGLRPSVLRRVRPWLAAAAVVLCVATFFLAWPYEEQRQRNAIISQLSTQYGVRVVNNDINNSLIVTISPSSIDNYNIPRIIPLLKRLGSVQTLDMRGSDNIRNLDALRHLSTLQSLYLIDCNSLVNVDSLKNLPALQRLFIRRCKSLANVDGLKGLPVLQTLDLTECENLASVEGLKNLPALQTLYLINCPKLTSVEGLKNLPALQALYLSSTSVTSVEGLKNLPNLQTLDLSSTSVTSVKGLPALETLNLVDCQKLTSVEGLWDLPALHTLSLGRCKSLANVDGLKGLPALDFLILTECENLTSIDALKGLPTLQILSLSKCVNLTSVEALKDLPALHKLELVGCKALMGEDALRNRLNLIILR